MTIQIESVEDFAARIAEQDYDHIEPEVRLRDSSIANMYCDRILKLEQLLSDLETRVAELNARQPEALAS